MATPRHAVEHDAAERKYQRQGGGARQRQDVVDQRVDQAGEQDQISRAADRQEARALDERGTTPSTRFWASPSARVGAVLALLAGVITLAMRVWPILPPQAHIDTRFPWWIATILVGLAYVGGFLLADRYWKSARVLLIVAGLVHLAIGLLAGMAVQAETGEAFLFSFLLEAGPAVLALVGAFLIGPPPSRREYDRRSHAE